ncbi:DNA primase [Cetobacterium somerae]|uniref:DNA primase n=1 Tax=Cetobacterium sp. NK01 TaxID=2993530 RepID=UPI002115DAC3|nr:DNA primase [Cetobacterium sp. NK01]MCQ8211255.1 DNA primase [Cetobacterium sp. NK01]
MKYKSEDIDLLLQQLHIEEVVGEFVDLKKAGANYKGLCPFHQDNHPSFVVSPNKNICKCFVCGAGGNPIKFYSEYKKISFVEAVEELAKKYNIPITKVGNSKINENKEYYDIMEEAHNYYKNEIFKNTARDALEYLSKRKINPKLIKENEIGYAPNIWTGLYDYLITKGFEKEKIFILGLAKESEKGIYDTFRNRVIFPIYSIAGKVIAFGGRSLEDSKEIPKYINSQETPIFTKGRNLYGFIQKGSNIKKKNYSILMEGYMDVLSAHSYGFDVALAPLGTALTEEQAQLLKKYTNNVILSFDMDEAGQKATERSILILKSEGFNIRVLSYKDAKDPDDYLKKYGKDAFLKVVKESLEAFDYLYLRYSSEYSLEDHMSKQNFINRFKGFFQCLDSDLEKSLYIDKLSKSLNIDLEILKTILITNNNKKRIKNTYEKKEESKDLDEKGLYNLEKLTLALILSHNEYFIDFKNKEIVSSLGKKIFQYIEFLQENAEKSTNIIKDIILTGNLTQDEEKELVNISLLSIDDFSNKLDIEKGFQIIFMSWFILELKEALKERSNLLKHIKLKKIEDKLKQHIEFNDLRALYSEFKNINA